VSEPGWIGLSRSYGETGGFRSQEDSEDT